MAEIEQIEQIEILDMENNKINMTKPFIMVIDNDECIGSWGDLSQLYSLHEIFNKTPSVETFSNLLIQTGCVRPYLREFYDTVLKMKSDGMILKIYMCTAAKNIKKWVSFLHLILEHWYGKKIYDGIIDGELIHEWHVANNTQEINSIGILKDMNQIRKIANVDINTPVVALDDRPTNILNGYRIKISPFFVAINLVGILRLYFSHWDDIDMYLVKTTYNNSLQQSWVRYLTNSEQFTNASSDLIVLHIANYLLEIFNNWKDNNIII